MSTAFSTLRQMVGGMMGTGEVVVVTGTPAATFAVNSFYCAALLLDEDDFYNEWHGRFYSGTHIGTNFEVTDSASGVITFTPSLSTAVDATDLFELHRDYTPTEIGAKINMAIAMVEDEALVEKVDETVTLTSTTYEYAIPSGFYTIYAIYQEETTDDLYHPVDDLIDPEYGWRLLRNGTTKKLWFDSNAVAFTTGRALRICGQSLASQLSADTDTTPINSAFLMQQAVALLHQSRIVDKSSVSERHERQMTLAQSMADRLRGGLFVTQRGVRVG
jgi:hypothetical protein